MGKIVEWLISGVVAGIIVAVIVSFVSRIIKKPRTWRGQKPTAFACASVNRENGVSNLKNHTWSFDFGQFQSPINNGSFVSLVYQFQKPMNMSRKEKLQLSLSFDSGNVDRVDVEFKDEQRRRQSSICYLTRGKREMTVDLHKEVGEAIMSDLKEICLVVKPDYGSINAVCQGNVTVQTLAIDGESLL